MVPSVSAAGKIGQGGVGAFLNKSTMLGVYQAWSMLPSENAHLTQPRSSWIFKSIVLKIAPKRPFSDTKSAIELARRLETTPNLFVVMRICSPVILSYLEDGFEPWCPRKDFLTACWLLLLLLAAAACLLLAKICCSSLDHNKGCKTSTG